MLRLLLVTTLVTANAFRVPQSSNMPKGLLELAEEEIKKTREDTIPGKEGHGYDLVFENKEEGIRFYLKQAITSISDSLSAL